jgi:hypothetical protein
VKRTLADKVAERFVVFVIFLVLVCSGWLVLLNEGLTLRGKRGDATFISGPSTLLYAGVLFAVAAGIAWLGARAMGGSRRTSWVIAVVVLLHPLGYFFD